MEIKMDKVDFNYGNGLVLHQIELLLKKPGLVCIMGPNGVGKSTLIRCINKIISPTGGNLYIDGKDIKELQYKDLAKEMGYVPVSSADAFPMTVFDTVLMGRHPHSGKDTKEEDLEIAYECMERLDVEDLAMRNFNELSSGQRQKVAIARGLAQEPKMLILDEPTSNLDVRYQMVVAGLLRELSRERRITVLMISHDINISTKYADEIIVMSKPGVICKVGHPNDVITKELIADVYGVDCDIVKIRDRPHVILLDPLDEIGRRINFF